MSLVREGVGQGIGWGAEYCVLLDVDVDVVGGDI